MVYQTPDEATNLKQMIADETKHLLERIEKLEAAQPQSPMIKGAVYELSGRGPAEYVGLDVFHGETTHQFMLNGRPYYVAPKNLALALSRPNRQEQTK